MSIRHISIFRLSLLAVVMLLGACNQTTLLAHVTPTPRETACGIGLLDHNVRIWVKGRDAQQVCGGITAMIRQQGSQPISWSGRISESVDNYQPVCSDGLPTLSYEIVDTGRHSYGIEWCQWMVQTYGTSGIVTVPDLFGIIGAAQQAAQALKQTYAASCQQHNGYVDKHGLCVVDYPGWISEPVAIKVDGTWDAYIADLNRSDCEPNIKTAMDDAAKGQTWSIPPQYHPDTGICVNGER